MAVQLMILFYCTNTPKWVRVQCYLVIVAQYPAETLHVWPNHLPPEILIRHVHVKLGLVVSLLPALLPQPAAHVDDTVLKTKLTQVYNFVTAASRDVCKTANQYVWHAIQSQIADHTSWPSYSWLNLWVTTKRCPMTNLNLPLESQHLCWALQSVELVLNIKSLLLFWTSETVAKLHHDRPWINNKS